MKTKRITCKNKFSISSMEEEISNKNWYTNLKVFLFTGVQSQDTAILCQQPKLCELSKRARFL